MTLFLFHKNIDYTCITLFLQISEILFFSYNINKQQSKAIQSSQPKTNLDNSLANPYEVHSQIVLERLLLIKQSDKNRNRLEKGVILEVF